jgi:hypothetical protein
MDADLIENTIKDFQQKFPPLITFDQASEIAHVPKGTLYEWSSRGLRDSFKTKPGVHVLLVLTAFVRFLMVDQDINRQDQTKHN